MGRERESEMMSYEHAEKERESKGIKRELWSFSFVGTLDFWKVLITGGFDEKAKIRDVRN